MSLTLPTAEQLVNFWGDEADTDEERADFFLQAAGDLMWLVTGLDSDPADPHLRRLVQYGIMDMAIYLQVNRSDLQSSYSGFSGEHIGSYSYTKQFTKQAFDASTGVPMFDRVVQWFLNQAFSDSSVTSEWVFQQGYVPDGYRVISQDPTDRIYPQYPLGSVIDLG